jgi:chorismate synthase
VIRVQGRHDPCIVPRLLPVAEAMLALVLMDAFLEQQKCRVFEQERA